MMQKEKLVALVQAVQQGDNDAYTQLYDSFYQDIYYQILKTVGKDTELAADLTQDTFVEILETIGNLREPAAFVTWSRQIAAHRCTAYFRKRRDILLDEEEDGYSLFDTLEEDRTEFIPDEALDREDLKQTIQGLIDRLPTEQRSALLMRYYYEQSVQEIAQAQGVSEGTVKSRLNYGRKALKQAVEDYEKKNGIRLHCAGVLPLLLWFFRAYRRANGMVITVGSASAAYGAAAATTAATGKAAASAATAAAAATTEKTGVAAGISAITKAAAVKTVAAVAAVGVAAAGVAAVVSGPSLPEKWSGYVESYDAIVVNINHFYDPEQKEYYAGNTPMEGNRMYVELEVLEAADDADSSYNGSLQITWDDGEVYYSDCQLIPGSDYGYTTYYTVVMDPVYWKTEWDPMNIYMFSSLDLIYDQKTDTLCVRSLGRYDMIGELTREDSGKTIFRDPPAADQEDIFDGFTGDELVYMQRIDGTYGWVTFEEEEKIKDYYAPAPEDGSARIGYREVVFVKEPDGDQVTVLIGSTPVYHEKIVNLVIPAEIDGLPVTEIRYISDESLESVELPDTITVIPEKAFQFCINLKTVKLPASIHTIEDRAFMYCFSLESLEIPEGVETLGNEVFAYSSGLKSIRFPAAMTRLGENVLFGCSGLEVIEVAPGNPVYHSSGNCLIETASATLIAGCAESRIPEDGSVTAIGKWAFTGNQSLTEIVIPEGVTEIRYAAFTECNSLREIHLPRSMESISNQAFKYCSNLTDVYYAGTMEEFSAIQGIQWDGDFQDFGRITVHCSDGNLTLG